MAVALITQVGVSFRAVNKIFITMELCLHLNIGSPSHTTVLNWTKKQGIANFREKEFFDDQKWVLIADESIQFGNKKLLAILALPATFKGDDKALSYSDITPLLLKVSTSWTSEKIAQEIEKHINRKQIAYGISDLGRNLIGAFKILNINYIEDINHKFSLIIQKVFSENEQFKLYCKELAGMRSKLPLSKFARIVPPNQRIMSRYMNLTPLFQWGVKMIKLFENNVLTEEEKEKLSFLPALKNFVIQTNELICSLNQIQKTMKTEGFNRKNVNKSLQSFDLQNNSNAIQVKNLIVDYFYNTLAKMPKGETIYCSSDIIESCFGKYKELVKTNKTVGISDLCLCIAALLGDNNSGSTKGAMEKVKTEQIRLWKKENIGDTLFADKMKLLKKAG